MKKLLIIIPYKKVYICAAAILILIGCICYFRFIKLDFIKVLHVAVGTVDEDVGELQRENEKLKGILGSLLPGGQKIIYENPYRSYKEYKPSFHTTSLREVVAKGEEISFKKLWENPDYLRPLYDSSWKGFYFRGWTYLPQKAQEARHRLFTFPFGLSSIFDFEGSLGFEESVPFDYHKNIVFLIYKFDVKKVKILGHQIALIGEPRRYGAQVVTALQDDLLPMGIDKSEFLIQLSTPKAYEIDFLYDSAIRYEYLKKQIEQNTVRSSYIEADIKRLKSENALLKDELSKYIPLEEGVIKEQHCKQNSSLKTLDIETVQENGEILPFKINYQNKDYRRPIYNPLWKKYYKMGWSYIPQKVCENLHTLFIIPKEPDRRADFLGSLGFSEEYKPVQNSDVGFLIYNFTVRKVVVFTNQIIITGTPSRTGAEIISISKQFLKGRGKYFVQLATPDNWEIDFDSMMEW